MKSVIKSAKTVDEAVELGLQELGVRKEDATIEIMEAPSRGLFGLIGSKDAVVKISAEDNFKEELLRDLRLPYIEKTEKTERAEKPVAKPEATVVKPVVKEEKKPEPPAEVPEEVKPVPPAKVEVKPEPIHEAAPVKEPVKKKPEPQKRPERPERREPQRAQVSQESDSPMTPVDVEVNDSAKLLKEMIRAMDIEAKYIANQKGNLLYLSAREIPEEKAGLVIGRRGETLDAMQYLLTLSANRRELGYSKVILDINDYREKREDALKQLALRSAEKVKKTNKNMKLEPMNPYERRIIHAELQKVEGVHTVSEGNEPYRRIVIRVNRNK